MPEPEGRPVNEVVLAVAIRPQDALAGPRLSQLLGTYAASHPRVQTVVPYEMPAELPHSAGITPPPQQIEIVGLDLRPRFWFLSNDDTEIIQVQRDYIAFNWRRGGGDAPYVHYDSIRTKFADLLETLTSSLRELEGAEIQPIRTEITYVNIIRRNRLWHALSDAHKVFRLDFPQIDRYERLTFSVSRPITSVDGSLDGRLHLEIKSGFDWLKEEPALGLNITARSVDMHDGSLTKVTAFLDRGHDEANSEFRELLTEDARLLWNV